MKRILKIPMFVVLMGLIAPTQAIELSEDVSLNGFGTFGLTKTTDSTWGYRSGLGNDQPVFESWDAKSRNIFGLQLNARFNEKWSSTLQVVHQEQFDNSLNRHIRIAALNYQLTPTWQIRAGRFSPKGSNFTDSKAVSYGYLWTNIPVEFEGQILTKAYDGFEVNYTHQFDVATSHTSFGFGKTTLVAGESHGYESLDFQPAFGLSQDIEWKDYTFRAGISGLRSRMQWIPELRHGWQQVGAFLPNLSEDSQRALNILDTDDAMIWVYALGAGYDDGDWTIQSEVIRLQSSSEIIHSATGAYFSVGHRFGEFTPYALASLFQTHSANFKPSTSFQTAASFDGNLNLLSQSTELTLSDMRQRSLGLGVRWDLNEHFALKAQWDRKFISGAVNAIWWNYGPLDGNKTIDVFTINLDYVF